MNKIVRKAAAAVNRATVSRIKMLAMLDALAPYPHAKTRTGKRTKS